MPRADAFGNEALSLDEMIEALRDVKERFPHLGSQPVWVANCPPLKWPVLKIKAEMHMEGPRTKIYVNRGGL